MKTLPIILLIVITIVIKVEINAQYIPTIVEGNKWELTIPTGQGIYLKWNEELTCDTLINNKGYNKLTLGGKKTRAYLREDTTLQHVYYFDLDSIKEKLWVSYNLVKGDSVYYGVDQQGIIHYHRVDSVYYKEAFGAVRKHIDFNDVAYMYIEGLGNVRDGIDPDMSWFSRITGFSPDGLGCAGLSNEDLKVIKEEKIYPNPFSDIITVENFSQKPVKYSLLNIYGNVFEEKIILNRDEFIIDDLIPGIYFIRSENGNIKKMIKSY